MNKKRIHIMLISIATITIFWLLSSVIADANMIEKYTDQINENNYRIEQIEEIKNQLHETAELIRKESIINNGFDLWLGEKWHEYNVTQQHLKSQNIDLKTKIEKEKSKRIFLGYFTCTHYDPCFDCNGNWGNQTALGTKLTPYRTIAVDPKKIPLGSKVEIFGKEYIA